MNLPQLVWDGVRILTVFKNIPRTMRSFTRQGNLLLQVVMNFLGFLFQPVVFGLARCWPVRTLPIAVICHTSFYHTFTLCSVCCFILGDTVNPSATPLIAGIFCQCITSCLTTCFTNKHLVSSLWPMSFVQQKLRRLFKVGQRGQKYFYCL